MKGMAEAKNYISFTDIFSINDMDKEGKKFDCGIAYLWLYYLYYLKVVSFLTIFFLLSALVDISLSVMVYWSRRKFRNGINN